MRWYSGFSLILAVALLVSTLVQGELQPRDEVSALSTTDEDAPLQAGGTPQGQGVDVHADPLGINIDARAGVESLSESQETDNRRTGVGAGVHLSDSETIRGLANDLDSLPLPPAPDVVPVKPPTFKQLIDEIGNHDFEWEGDVVQRTPDPWVIVDPPHGDPIDEPVAWTAEQEEDEKHAAKAAESVRDEETKGVLAHGQVDPAFIQPPSTAPPLDGASQVQSTEVIPTSSSLGPASTIAFAAAVAAPIAFVAGRRLWLRALRYLGFAGLFTRLSEEDLLSHPRRADLLDYVRENPGQRIQTVRDALSISNGALWHHLHLLQQRGLIKVHHDGVVARLFVGGPRVNPTPYVPPVRRLLLDQLKERPGLTQRELARAAGMSDRVVSYHVGQLSSSGLVRVEREGGAKRCFMAQP